MSEKSLTTRTHVVREYLHENKKIWETIFAGFYGAQVKFYDKKGRNSRGIVPLNGVCHEILTNIFFMMRIHPGPWLTGFNQSGKKIFEL